MTITLVSLNNMDFFGGRGKVSVYTIFEGKIGPKMLWEKLSFSIKPTMLVALEQ